MIKTTLLSFIVLLLQLQPLLGVTESLLVEAESFSDKGGWVVDPQFMDIMGSPFLMAHGLGKPVSNATTTVNIPEKGTYRVWVRTRNWVPGDWEAPGRFQVLVNGQALAPIFGTRDEAWAWQNGGDIELAAGEISLALHDLTGFNGRCDAIFLTKDLNSIPPNDIKTMRQWRNHQLGFPDPPAKTEVYDLVVVGGGIAGCAASIAAGEQGLNVALIHDRQTFGGVASGEIRVNVIGIKGREPARRILDRLTWNRNGGNGSPVMLKDDVKRDATMENAFGVELFRGWRAYDVAMEGERITAVYAQNIETGECRAFKAPVFVDSTGDGWIGFWAGAEFRYGRESVKEFGEYHPNNKKKQKAPIWSPEEPDKRVLGTTLMWNSRKIGRWEVDGEKKTFIPDTTVQSFPSVPWAMEVAGKIAKGKADWYWEFSRNDLHQVNDAEYIRDHMLRAIFGVFSNYSKTNPGAELQWVGYISGKRESRRLMGDHIFTLNDIWQDREFLDAVVEGKRGVDLHFQTHEYPRGKQFPWSGEVDFSSWMISGGEHKYQIPFRSLYSNNIDNLMMAGRCFSTSHVGLGGPRIMNVTGQMGVAVGYAASLCKKHDTTPRGVYESHLPELVRLAGYDNPSGGDK
jgi:hypothetical protein